MGARGPRTDNDRLWIGYLSAGALVLLAYYLVPPDGAGAGVRITLYCLDSASAAVMVVLGIVRNRPRPRLPWVLLGLSQVVYAAADTSFYRFPFPASALANRPLLQVAPLISASDRAGLLVSAVWLPLRVALPAFASALRFRLRQSAAACPAVVCSPACGRA